MNSGRARLSDPIIYSRLEAAQDAATGPIVVSRQRPPQAAPMRTGEVEPVSDPQPNPNNKPMKAPRTLLAALAGLLLAAAEAAAQTTVILVKDDVVQLSPFEVSAEKDTGYRASGTLAGTRLRTELRDVAASITVVTKDFMQDIAANNLDDLLTYTAGTEIEGLSGNFSGSSFNSNGFQEFNGASRRVQSETRVRGLGGADQTRDYFLTDTPMDGYNLDRVEVNRGPNAILFGLGKPGGIVNSGMIKGLTNRTTTKVEAQFDQESSRRLVLDHNQVLVKDVLALRFASLLSDKRYQIKPAYIRDERYFLTGTWRPWKGGQLRLSSEWADQKSAKPYTTPPWTRFRGGLHWESPFTTRPRALAPTWALPRPIPPFSRISPSRVPVVPKSALQTGPAI